MPTTKDNIRVPTWVLVLFGTWLVVTSVAAVGFAWAASSDLAVIKTRTEHMDEFNDRADELNLRLSAEE